MRLKRRSTFRIEFRDVLKHGAVETLVPLQAECRNLLDNLPDSLQASAVAESRLAWQINESPWRITRSGLCLADGVCVSSCLLLGAMPVPRLLIVMEVAADRPSVVRRRAAGQEKAAGVPGSWRAVGLFSFAACGCLSCGSAEGPRLTASQPAGFRLRREDARDGASDSQT